MRWVQCKFNMRYTLLVGTDNFQHTRKKIIIHDTNHVDGKILLYYKIIALPTNAPERTAERRYFSTKFSCALWTILDADSGSEMTAENIYSAVLNFSPG